MYNIGRRKEKTCRTTLLALFLRWTTELRIIFGENKTKANNNKHIKIIKEIDNNHWLSFSYFFCCSENCMQNNKNVQPKTDGKWIRTVANHYEFHADKLVKQLPIVQSGSLSTLVLLSSPANAQSYIRIYFE